jgi:hypothetical protein
MDQPTDPLVRQLALSALIGGPPSTGLDPGDTGSR